MRSPVWLEQSKQGERGRRGGRGGDGTDGAGPCEPKGGLELLL